MYRAFRMTCLACDEVVLRYATTYIIPHVLTIMRLQDDRDENAFLVGIVDRPPPSQA